jgi:LL-diaminopimelate aminotransferase
MRAAHRVTNMPPYVFAVLGQRIRQMEGKGPKIIRLDMGDPDLPPHPFLIEQLKKSIDDPNKHGYGGYFGTPQLRKAIAHYYQHRFGVELDSENEVLPLIGSKEGLANINLAWLDPGDIGLAPDPGYPTYTMGAVLAGAKMELMPLLPERQWTPDFSKIPPAVAEKARLMWLNYPNNPTGAVADLALFEEAIAFCRKYDILFCHDNPYCDLAFDGHRPVSALQIPGAKDVVLEFNSLSKTYNMAGWRVGMAVGNPVAVKALGKTKTQIDSGIPKPVQDMAIAGLTGDQSWLKERNAIYQERRDLVIGALKSMGIDVDPPKAAFYVWFKVPKGYTSESFQDHMLEKARVSIAPGTFYGAQGAGYMRLGLVMDKSELMEAMERMRKLGW